MSTHPTVPPLRRRTTPEAVVPTTEPPAPPAPKNTKVMVYLPGDMVADVDDMRGTLRRQDAVVVDRSAAVRAAIRFAQAHAEDWIVEIMREAS